MKNGQIIIWNKLNHMEGVCNMITLEDGIKYFITKEIKKDNVIYVYLTNIKDVTDFCIRKTNESKEMLNPLDSEEEFDMALDLFKTTIEE